MNTNTDRVQIEEVTSVLTPAEGVSLAQAIEDAQLAGYELLTVEHETNQATIRWFKRGQ